MTFVDCLPKIFQPLTLGFVCLLVSSDSSTQSIQAMAFSRPVAQDESLETLQQQWGELESQFAEKQAAMESGEGDLKALREEYTDLIDRSNDLIKKMKSASIKAVEADNQDTQAVRAIMGILMNAAQAGRDLEVLDTGDQLIASEIDPQYFEVAAKADRLSIDAKEIFEELLIRQREAAADDLPRVKLTTSKGEIVLELYENEAPNTVANFISLVESGYYSDRLFFRVLEDFMAQTGGKKSDGTGEEGPGYKIQCECYTPETRPHFSHVASMALAGKDTGGGQFYLTFSRTDFLDGRHTVFGRIVSGGDLLDKIERTHIPINGQEQPIPNVEKDTIINAEVVRKRDHNYQPKKIGDPAAAAEPKNDKPPSDPNLEKPKMEIPKSDEVGKEEPETASEKAEETKGDAAKAEVDAKKEEALEPEMVEEPEKVEEPETEEPKAEEPKAEEPKAEELEVDGE